MFTERLLKLRDRSGLSQKEIARRLGIARTTYSGYENGSREPDIEMINKIAHFHGVSTDYLLGVKNTKESEFSLPEDEFERIVKEIEEEQNIDLHSNPIAHQAVRQALEIIVKALKT